MNITTTRRTRLALGAAAAALAIAGGLGATAVAGGDLSSASAAEWSPTGPRFGPAAGPVRVGQGRDDRHPGGHRSRREAGRLPRRCDLGRRRTTEARRQHHRLPWGSGAQPARRGRHRRLLAHRRYGVRERAAGRGSWDGAADIVDEAFLAVLARLRHAPIHDLRSYLWRAAFNGSIGVRSVELRATRAAEQVAGGTSTVPGPEASRSHGDLVAALGRLDPETRTIIVLRYYADLTVPQIAAARRLPLGTVKCLIHRGMSVLRRDLGGADPVT